MRITKYIGKSDAVIVPDSIDGLPITEIGEAAFKGNSVIASVDLPDTVEVIGRRAFANCSGLESMN